MIKKTFSYIQVLVMVLGVLMVPMEVLASSMEQ